MGYPTIEVNIPNTGIANLAWTQLYSFGVSLNNGGGSWNIGANVEFGAVGTPITIFGLTGFIEEYGFRYNTSMKGPAAQGIFGNPLVNKELDLITGNASLYLANTVTTVTNGQYTVVAALSSTQEMAAYLAKLVGVDLTWQCRNVPLNTFTLSPTMTVLSAFNALAAQAGGVLRWNGNNSYIICNPNYTTGTFTIPNQDLIAVGGIEGYLLYNLQTGISGAYQGASLTLPILYSPISVGQASAPPASLAIQKIGSIGKLLTAQDPPFYIPMPANFDKVYIQIVVADTGDTSGQYVVPDSQKDSLTGWSILGSDGASPYVSKVLIGNQYVTRFTGDYTLFSSNNNYTTTAGDGTVISGSAAIADNTSIQGGHFTCNIGCTLKDLPIVDSSYTLEATPIQYIKKYQGSIHCVFYGVMPLPGMFASATVDDRTVSGVIENVSFSPPGYLSIDVAQYIQINYVQPLASITATT